MGLILSCWINFDQDCIQLIIGLYTNIYSLLSDTPPLQLKSVAAEATLMQAQATVNIQCVTVKLAVQNRQLHLWSLRR
ncbi:hypothetical protein IGI04_010657 [Brassica rapa subsp. trilocularis]|uniref:Uncharacterized protein n=1 Tax=Brassica rapa subsp. trilocularis TaxID=1813537 RepID=A0ABQ7N0T0_BRACM|nr:hypothetical protein IGI04_010657 [Brassica rapa subsp. trilocularis]